MIDSLQKQTDFSIGEAIRPRCAPNSRIPISRLPAELLSDVFLYVVEGGLQNDTRFATGTFNFLQVCRHWNEVAVGFPQLWVWWVMGAFKAWPQFKSRSKDAPVFLMWRRRRDCSTLDVLKDAGTPRRIRELDLSDTYAQLENLLGALDSISTSVTSSVRFYGTFGEKNGEHLTRFLSLPFPKLAEVDIGNFLPDPSSSIFTTSNLTSLKLSLSYKDKGRYTRSQFSNILRHHPNLRQLSLQQGAIPPVEKSGAPGPIFLPRLVDLTLYGTESVIAGFIDLVSISSLLYNIVIHFSYTSDPVLISTIKRILTEYCYQGPDYPRKVNNLTISSDPLGKLSFDAGAPSTPALNPAFNLNLRFHAFGHALARDVVPLFPLEHVREFAVVGLYLSTGFWRRTLRKMNNLSLLWLNGVDVGLTLDPLNPNCGGVYREATNAIFTHSRVHS